MNVVDKVPVSADHANQIAALRQQSPPIDIRSAALMSGPEALCWAEARA